MSGRMRMYLVVNRLRFRGLKVLTVIFHFIFIFYFFFPLQLMMERIIIIIIMRSLFSRKPR